MTVRVKRLSEVALPARGTPGAAGFDLCAAEDTTVPARGFASVGTGLAIEMPDDTEAQVRPRSGLAARHGIGVLNSPGTIDSDYRGEVRVVLFNLTGADFRISRGERIAQLVFSKVISVELIEAASLSDTSRGPGGFGHTGR
jgi:dUTP pyrophosphatase